MQSKYCKYFLLLIILCTLLLFFGTMDYVNYGLFIRSDNNHGNRLDKSLPKHKLLVVVPGFSFQPASLALVLRNIEALQGDTRISVSCLIYHYTYPSHIFFNASQSEDAYKLRTYCDISAYSGSDYGYYVKAVNPALARQGGFTHIMLLLDDVELKNFHVGDFMDIMTYNNLTLASPAVQQGQFPCNRRENIGDEPGGTVTAIEIFAAVFTMDAFACFWTMVDPFTNYIGWGYDLYFQFFCTAIGHPQRLGIITYKDMTVVHRPQVAKGDHTPRSVLKDTFLQQAVQQEEDIRGVLRTRYGIALPLAKDLRERTQDIPLVDHMPLKLPRHLLPP